MLHELLEAAILKILIEAIVYVNVESLEAAMILKILIECIVYVNVT
jgi:hypothetical protein